MAQSFRGLSESQQQGFCSRHSSLLYHVACGLCTYHGYFSSSRHSSLTAGNTAGQSTTLCSPITVVSFVGSSAQAPCVILMLLFTRQVMSDSLWHHGLRPPGSFVHGISQARILGWVVISFSRGIFPTQGWNLRLLCLLHCRQILYPLSHRGRPCVPLLVAKPLESLPCWLLMREGHFLSRSQELYYM